jgi:hypothetical protein
MEELLTGVAWTPVIVGAVLAYLFGWLWYSPKMFALKWVEGVGIAPTDTSPVVIAMITQAVGTFLLAWLVGITAASNSLATMILIAITIGTLTKANGLFCKKSHYAIATETGFVYAMVIVMILVHALL